MVQRDFSKGKNILLIYDLNISRGKMLHIPLKRGSNYLSNDIGHNFLCKISRSQSNKTFLPFEKSRCTIAQHLTYIWSRRLFDSLEQMFLAAYFCRPQSIYLFFVKSNIPSQSFQQNLAECLIFVKTSQKIRNLSKNYNGSKMKQHGIIDNWWICIICRKTQQYRYQIVSEYFE